MKLIVGSLASVGFLLLGFLYAHGWISDLASIASVTCSLLTIGHLNTPTHE